MVMVIAPQSATLRPHIRPLLAALMPARIECAAASLQTRPPLAAIVALAERP
jgi:hypothetical protein